jgi:hypothetical protein
MAARTTVTLTAPAPARLANSLGLAAGDRQVGDVLSLRHADAVALVEAGVARFGSTATDAATTPTVPSSGPAGGTQGDGISDAELATLATQATAQAQLDRLNLLSTQATSQAQLDRLSVLATQATAQAQFDLINNNRTPTGAHLVGNVRTRFRDGFASTDTAQPDPAVWTMVNDHPDPGAGPGGGMGHIVDQGGDANGASYLRISMSPFLDNSSVWLVSKQKLRMPTRIGWGVSTSQRILGQELLFGVAEAAPAGSTDPTTIRRNPPQTPADVAVTNPTAAVGGNFLVLGMPVGHPFRPGDRVIIVGCADTRLNVGPVIVAGAAPNDISVPLTIANGNYNATGGAVRSADPLARAHNGLGLLLENTNHGNASLVGRRNGAKPRIRSQSISTTLAAGSQTWADSILAPSVQELALSMDECSYRSWPADATAGMNGVDKFSQSIPDEDADYRLIVRARNLDDLSKPVARIVNAVKTGTTTVTVTTDRPHGLTTNSRIGLNGARDQTALVNTPDVAVTSVIDATTFTVMWGTAGSFSSTAGGVVFVNHGQVNVPGASNFAIQTIARANGVLVATLSGTVTGFSPGEYVHLWGMNGPGAAAFEGAYKVMRVIGSTIELAAPGPDVADIVTGGAVIKRTDYRLHFVRMLDHTRHLVEVLGGRGNQSDGNNAVPVAVTGTPTFVPANPMPVVGEQQETTGTLGANLTYSGSTRDLGTDFARQPTRLKVMVRHLAGITPGHLYLEQSVDNFTSTFETWRCPIPSDGAVHTFEVPIFMRYYRWRFLNGGTAQTGFLLHTRRSLIEGTVASEIARNLPFLVTAAAGQAIAAGATVNGPSLDLGVNHNWDRVRTFYRTDVAGMTVAIEGSLDNTNWYWVNGHSNMAAAGSGTIQAEIAGFRYVRARMSAGATAAVSALQSLSLVSL